MSNNDLNTEQIILNAAEAEFLEKGYSGAKTVGIAKRAGVSHSMLHYYFRKKKNLFNMIFQQKIQVLSKMFEETNGQNLPFSEMIRSLIESHFNFIAQNPQLPRFILNETAKKESLDLLIEVAIPKFMEVFKCIEQALNEEIKLGKIRPVQPRDLFMNICAMNIAAVVFMSTMETIEPVNKKAKKAYLAESRENNVQFILNALRP